jgi:hypothetical protein
MSEFTKADTDMRGDSLAPRSRVASGCPGHIGDVIGRPQMRDRIAMAINAELHCKGLVAVSQGHRVDATVARHAADALGDVDVMPKEDIVRELRHPYPAERLAIGETSANRFEHGGICPDLGMACHAGCRWRQSCLGTFLDIRVAIAAIDSKFAGVVTVAKGHRLMRHLVS